MTVDRASKVTAVVDVGNTPFVNARIQCSAQKRSDLRHRVLGIALSQWSNPFAAGMKDHSQLPRRDARVPKGESRWRKNVVRSRAHPGRRQSVNAARRQGTARAVEMMPPSEKISFRLKSQ